MTGRRSLNRGDFIGGGDERMTTNSSNLNIETIAGRRMKLDQMMTGIYQGADQTHLANRESLLDAFVTLYDECNESSMKRDKNAQEFIAKYRNVCQQFNQLRVNCADFELKQLIGKGYFGEVQLVTEKKTRDVYAMKIMKKHDMLSKNSVNDIDI